MHFNALKAFQKPVESSTHFSEAIREAIPLSKICNVNQIYASTKRKKGIIKPGEESEYNQLTGRKELNS